MKKMIMILLAVVLCLAMIGCGTKTEQAAAPAESAASSEETVEVASEEAVEAASEETAEPEIGTGVYTVYNQTGETVTDLYIFETGSEDKGENFAGEGFAADENMELTYEAATDAQLTICFVTESGYEAAFETLHIEEAPISLLSVDGMTGATPISFKAAE